MKNLSTTLLEQKTSKLEKNLCQRSQMSQILPHSWFKMRWSLGDPSLHTILSIPMPSQSKVKQYQDHEVDSSHLSDKSFEVFGKRPFRWQLEAAQAILCGRDVSTLELEVGRHYASRYHFFSTIATLPWLSPPSQHLWLTRHVNFTFKYSICLPAHRQINLNYLP